MTLDLKSVFIGTFGVGKTTLLTRISGSLFPPDSYIPTVCDSFKRYFDSDSITFWDSAGQSSYDRLRPLVYPTTDVFVIVFSVANRDSFDQISAKWIPELQFHCPTVSMIIVATHCDLRDSETSKVNDFITFKEVEPILNSLSVNLKGYYEVSGLTFIGINQLVDRIVDVGRANRGKSLGSGSSFKTKLKSFFAPPPPPPSSSKYLYPTSVSKSKPGEISYVNVKIHPNSLSVTPVTQTPYVPDPVFESLGSAPPTLDRRLSLRSLKSMDSCSSSDSEDDNESKKDKT